MIKSEYNEDIEVFLSPNGESLHNAPLVLPSFATMKMTAAERRWKLLKNLAVGCKRFNSLTANERKFLNQMEHNEDTTQQERDVTDTSLEKARVSLKDMIAKHKSQLTTTEALFLEALTQSPNITLTQLKISHDVLNTDPLFQESNHEIESFPAASKPIRQYDSFRSEVWTYSKSTGEEGKEEESVLSGTERPKCVVTPSRPSFVYRFFSGRLKSSTVSSCEEVEEEESKMSPVIFSILGTSADDFKCQPHVLSPPMMDALRPFLPFVVQQDNFWLKYSLVRDGASLRCLLSKVRSSARCLIAIETMNGQVFGSFTSTPFRLKAGGFYGSGEAFVWMLSKSRLTPCETVENQVILESNVQVFPWSGKNRNVQYLHSTDSPLLIGGGGPDNDPTITGGSALSISATMDHGFSDPSITFDSSVLCGDSGMFEIANIEVWTLTPANQHEQAERLELGRQFIFDHGHFVQH
jgi:TLD